MESSGCTDGEFSPNVWQFSILIGPLRAYPLAPCVPLWAIALTGVSLTRLADHPNRCCRSMGTPSDFAIALAIVRHRVVISLPQTCQTG
ncbi:MAG: hypothetical protein EA001_13490 [Oscillatoriales cyanobacterium]|nr:MAG: hypothetical protein EA001_13490 [Oscillatoriales cyanobacterium]